MFLVAKSWHFSWKPGCDATVVLDDLITWRNVVLGDLITWRNWRNKVKMCQNVAPGCITHRQLGQVLLFMEFLQYTNPDTNQDPNPGGDRIPPQGLHRFIEMVHWPPWISLHANFVGTSYLYDFLLLAMLNIGDNMEAYKLNGQTCYWNYSMMRVRVKVGAPRSRT